MRYKIMKHTKRILGLLLAIAMVFSFIPSFARSANASLSSGNSQAIQIDDTIAVVVSISDADTALAYWETMWTYDFSFSFDGEYLEYTSFELASAYEELIGESGTNLDPRTGETVAYLGNVTRDILNVMLWTTGLAEEMDPPESLSTGEIATVTFTVKKAGTVADTKLDFYEEDTGSTAEIVEMTVTPPGDDSGGAITVSAGYGGSFNAANGVYTFTPIAGYALDVIYVDGVPYLPDTVHNAATFQIDTTAEAFEDVVCIVATFAHTINFQ
jgi:hypothetical protein